MLAYPVCLYVCVFERYAPSRNDQRFIAMYFPTVYELVCLKRLCSFDAAPITHCSVFVQCVCVRASFDAMHVQVTTLHTLRHLSRMHLSKLCYLVSGTDVPSVLCTSVGMSSLRASNKAALVISQDVNFTCKRYFPPNLLQESIRNKLNPIASVKQTCLTLASLFHLHYTANEMHSSLASKWCQL